MSEERKVMHMLGPKLGPDGWKTIRSALDSWGRTMRFAVLWLALCAPVVAVLWLFADRVAAISNAIHLLP